MDLKQVKATSKGAFFVFQFKKATSKGAFFVFQFKNLFWFVLLLRFGTNLVCVLG
jgi:hypothetical protein